MDNTTVNRKAVAALLLSMGAALVTASPLPAAPAGTGRTLRPLGPALLNALPGLGVGSFVMGDPLGGVIGLGGELAGAALFVGGLTTAVARGIALGLGGATGGQQDRPSATDAAIEAAMIGGAALWAGTKVFELIRPFWFAARMKARLEPLLSVGQRGLSLTARLRFSPPAGSLLPRRPPSPVTGGSAHRCCGRQ